MTIPAEIVAICRQCGSELAPAMRACPGCGRLVYADRLSELALAANAASDRGDATAAMSAWREALELLPADSRQHQVVAAKITELGSRIERGSGAASTERQSPALRLAAGVGALGLLLWKLKALLLGLTKGTTLFTMLLSLGAYWTMWGWKFALGMVLSIYVHEMGHVFALRRYGFRAGAPMFIPGLGALIRMQQQVVNPKEDAAIGLAGPIYGLGAALVALGLWRATELPVFAAIAGVGAWINLFNLMPLGSLDGGRGFHAMSRAQRLLAALVVGAAWWLTGDGVLLLVGIVGLARVLGDKAETAGSSKTTVLYILLVASLTAISLTRTQIEIGDEEVALAPPRTETADAPANNRQAAQTTAPQTSVAALVRHLRNFQPLDAQSCSFTLECSVANQRLTVPAPSDTRVQLLGVVQASAAGAESIKTRFKWTPVPRDRIPASLRRMLPAGDLLWSEEFNATFLASNPIYKNGCVVSLDGDTEGRFFFVTTDLDHPLHP